MCHGDLTPPNVLVQDGRLAGVLDGGGFGPADPSLDLVGAWHLLDADQRAVVRAALGCSELEWARGRAWALQQAMGLVWYYAESNPTMSRWGRRTLDRLTKEGTSAWEDDRHVSPRAPATARRRLRAGRRRR
jgi:aminoglycoside phosphotransferase (APT) family kinase protein